MDIRISSQNRLITVTAAPPSLKAQSHYAPVARDHFDQGQDRGRVRPALIEVNCFALHLVSNETTLPTRDTSP